MAAKIVCFPVGNGDMTLMQLESGRTILIDINIREPGDDVRDVAPDLRNRLKLDSTGRPYVDAMLLSHPDQDHCRGLVQHFHLGPLEAYKQPKSGEPAKIVIREMWSQSARSDAAALHAQAQKADGAAAGAQGGISPTGRNRLRG
jgi:beta-lactamase superfamily II metal-dependent hydrolase